MSRLRGNPWAILVVLCLGFLMTLLDLTIVNIAVPNIMAELSLSYDQVLWVLSGYVLVLAVFLITSGRLGDTHGRRRLYLTGVAVFTTASLVCGLSTSPTELIAARGVQGLGAALLMPQTMSVIVAVFPKERRGTALGVWGAVAGVATIAGPMLGGILVSAFGWRWIFFVNVPVGALVLIVAPLIIPRTPRGTRKHRFDISGVVLSSLALLCVTFGLDEGQRYHWGRIFGFVTVPEILGLGVVLAVLFLLAQRRRQATEPLLPFALFSDRNYTLMIGSSAALSVGMIGMYLGFVLYLQSVLGLSAQQAGLVMVPMSVLSACLAPLAGRMADRIGGKYLLCVGGTMFAIGLIVLELSIGRHSSALSVFPGLMIIGFGLGCTFAPLSTVAMRDVPVELAGAASGVLNTGRQLGSVMGTVIAGALLQNRLAAGFTNQANALAGTLPESVRHTFLSGFGQLVAGGLNLGANTSRAPIPIPRGLPTTIAAQLEGAARTAYVDGFLSALHTALLLPICVVALGAISCLFLRGKRPARVRPVAAPAPSVAVGER